MPRDTFPLKVAGAAASALLLLLAIGLYTIFGVDQVGVGVGTVLVRDELPPSPSYPSGSDRAVARSGDLEMPPHSPSAALPLDPAEGVGLGRSGETPSLAADPIQIRVLDSAGASDRTAKLRHDAPLTDDEAAAHPADDARPPAGSPESLPPRPRLLGVPVYREPLITPAPVEPDTFSRALPVRPGPRQARE